MGSSYRKAIDYLTKSEGFGLIWNSVGWCDERLGMMDKAAESFKKNDQAPDNEVANRHLVCLDIIEDELKIKCSLDGA